MGLNEGVSQCENCGCESRCQCAVRLIKEINERVAERDALAAAVAELKSVIRGKTFPECPHCLRASEGLRRAEAERDAERLRVEMPDALARGLISELRRLKAQAEAKVAELEVEREKDRLACQALAETLRQREAELEEVRQAVTDAHVTIAQLESIAEGAS